MKETVYVIGDTVHIRNAPEIEGTITAVLGRTGGYVEYEVTWVADGDVKVAWLSPIMLITEKTKGPLGFGENSK